MNRAALTGLFDLQELDVELDRLTAEQAALQRQLEEDTTRPAREVLARAHARAEKARSDARAAEIGVQDAEARIKRQEQRLYGGGTGARDLTALQTELEHLKAAHAEQEEQALAVMVAAEEADAEEALAQAALKSARRDWDERRASIAARLADEAAHTEDMREQRVERAAAIDADLLRRYDALRKSHGGRAVALVQGGTCQSCRVVVSSGTLQRARAATELVLCTNCGRILYVR